jgi:hypothetical protein
MKHAEDQILADTKARIREELLGRNKMKNIKDKHDMKIEELYNKVHEFKFKALRPWVVLSAGDCINS